MSTAVISDLHLGSGNGEDMLRSPAARERLFSALEGAETLVLLGDVVELRDRPLGDALELATPFLGDLGAAMAGRRIVLVPGNHDHHLLDTWLEERRLEGAEPLGLEERWRPRRGPAGAVVERLAPADAELAYPGLWLAPGVYATHGHYLDRHLTIPTFERLGVAAVERILGVMPVGADPLMPPGQDEPPGPDEYERAQAPVYAFLYALAQAGVRNDAASPSARIWAALGGGSTRAARLRGWLLGSVALPGAVGVANRLGLGPVRSDLSPDAIARAGLAAMAAAVERLRIDAAHVIFGHTHRRGPMARDPVWTAGAARLLNTGSWVHSPSLLGDKAAASPYWPGTMALVDDEGPRLVHVLDELSRSELAELASAPVAGT